MIQRKLAILLLLLGAWSIQPASAQETQPLIDSLIFHAPFDGSPDATKSKGDGKIFTAESLARKEKRPGMVRSHVQLVKGQGRYGDCLRFTDKSPEVLCFAGSELPYSSGTWSTSISMWLKLDPDKDLKPGYCDPLQATDKTWNNAAIFIDFDKELPRDFRLGVFSDLTYWNPQNIEWDKWPVEKRPMVSVKKPPFAADSWTHIVMTLDKINAPNGADATATLYLNSRAQGSLRQPLKFTWDPEQAAIMLGIEYIGDMDDLMIFNRALNAAEVEQLYRLNETL